jgi:hypothetical protein
VLAQPNRWLSHVFPYRSEMANRTTPPPPYEIVWGEIQDADSFALIDQVWTLPAKKQGGLTFLDEPLHFTVELV